MNKIQTIGKGGLGIVSLYQDQNGQFYAVKQMQFTWDESHFQRFIREIQIMANLVHENIVKVLNYDMNRGNPWYVMPYFKEGSLRNRIDNLKRQNNIYTPKAGSALIYYLANALSYAHSKGCIHRDLKPENILFENDKPIIADWGIGKFIHRESKVLTQSGAGIGTQIYCAPEQWAGNNSDHRSDIYSLGIIYRELLTGAPNGRVNDARINAIINRMTAFHPSERYQSMEEIKAAIKSLEVVNTENPLNDFLSGAATVTFAVALGIGIAYVLDELFG